VIRKIPEERKSQEAILPGTRFVRIWNDQRYEVIARDSGYEYDGRICELNSCSKPSSWLFLV
jgi:hypothetical protein